MLLQFMIRYKIQFVVSDYILWTILIYKVLQYVTYKHCLLYIAYCGLLY